jgi:3',5'-cyclic AMP phosphodiesterase CpdA
MLNYSEELLDAWLQQVIAAKPKAVILSGDLTNNGERASHEELAIKLSVIKNAGIDVYVIPGNHDILNPWARSFEGERQLKTDYISPQQFETIYADFGYTQAAEKDKDSLSYLVEMSDNLWVLMLDTNMYDHNLDAGYPVTEGELSKSTLAWIGEQGASAKKAGAQIFAVMHHNLIDHSELSSLGFTINNKEQVTTKLKDAGINLVLSGHSHVQDIRLQDHMVDIATSAFEVYPHQFGVLHYTSPSSALEYTTKKIDVESWGKSNTPNNEDLTKFTKYSIDFFLQNSYDKVYKSLSSQSYSEKERDNMARDMTELNLHYYAGTVNEMDKDFIHSEGIKLWNTAKPQFLKTYVLSMLKDPKENNVISIHLSPDK